MQNRGDYNHQPSPNPPDPGTLGLRGKKEKDVAMVDVAKGKEDDTVLVLEGKKKEGEDDDFIMTDVGSESVGFPVKGSTTSEDVTLAVDLDKAFENDLSGKEGRGMKMVPTEGPGEEKDDDRLEEWQCDDSMFGESKQESDDEFDFDSEEEGEESRGGSYSVVPSLSKAFDLNLLRDCIEKGEDSLRHIEGKDVILIVGKTGTGKSCLIQGIAGKSFKKASFSCGDAVSKDVFEARDPVPGFEIGHAKVSMTKHIKCFFREGNTNREIAYLDTPGFEDTEGEEIDVGTSCMLSQVAKKCRTMRFVMMINYVSLLEDRGGAMRSILKFMRNFVRDFNKEKKSFMFLFTHADEIKDVPDSLEGAKKSLLNEIIRTLSGTQDDDVKDLLSFIRKSLEKGYPFADVLHPLKTDYKSLVNFMEHKLKTTKVLGENGSCGLTLSSQMRLSGAAQTLLRNLRMLLGQGDVDIAEVCEIQRAFKFFDKYINCEDMRVAVADCNGIMCDHVKSLHGVVERELYNGTNSTGTFNDLNVSHLNNALSQLQAVDLSFDMRAQLNRIHREVTKFQNRLFIDPARESFNGFHQDLQKLKTWSTFTTDCQLLLDPVIAHVATIVKEATNAISFFNESGTCSSSKSTLQQAFLNLKVLKSINENARSLSLYIEGVNNASEVMNNFLFQLKSSAEVWNEQLTTAGKEVNFGDLQGIQDLVSHIQTLDMVSGLLKDIGLEDEIFLLVEFIRKTITSKITGRFSNACLDLKSIDYGHDALWSEKVYVLRDVLSAFSPLEGSQWKNMESSYMTVVDGMKSRLRAKSGELDEISQSAVSHGLVDGMRDGKAVSIFARYQWFDNFLPSEERFVRNCVTKITNDYSRMFSASAESVEGIIFWLSSHTENPLELAEATIELKSSLSDISECARFGSTIEEQDLSNRAAELFDKLEVYMRIRVGAWKKTLDEWVGTVLNKSTDWEKVTVVTEDLNFMLWEVQEMVDISCAQDVQVLIKSVQDEIISTMVNFKEQVKSSFDSQISYEEIALSLARVQALGDFSRTSPYLPRVEDLKEAARQRVSNDAKKIEDLVEETSEFDEIDRLLVQFERASVLDEFVSQEVSSRLRPLKRLRTDKEEDVDECIKEMIQNNDFSGLGAFLQPLAKSRNQIQRRKFEKYVDKINDSLKEVDRKFHYNFHGTMTEEGCQKIASILKILDQANDQVGDYLPKKKHAPSIGTKVRDYKKKINTKFNTMLNKMNTAIKRADFVDITKVNGPITIASKYFGPYLTDNSERKRKEVIESYSELKQSIPSHIRTFVETSFSESKEIEKILSGLKPIAEMKDPVFIDLVQLYDETAKALLEQVNELVQKVKDSSAEAQCYDDAVVIIQNLTRALEKGLGDHLPQTLHDDCKTTLRKLEEHRKEEFEISFEASSAAFQLKAIGKTMDKLDPDASIWNFSKFLTGRRTYDNLKNKWSIEALQIYRRGSKALKRREFTTLNESLFLLSLMNDTIASHVTIVSSKLQDLKGETVGAFLLLCKSSQDALQSENCRAFETLFADYRGFVIGITCLMKVPDAVKSFNATNQLVYERMGKEVSSLNETLDSARDGFDFAVMKQKIEAVRAFGGFIADRFSTFHEELKGVGHVKSDRWLGMLHGMILKHYQNGRDLQRLKFYAILEVFPSASKNEVKQAYGEKCGKLLASKESDISRSALAHINDAMSELEKDEAHQRDRTAKPFDDEVCGIGNGLRETTRKALKEQDYDLVEATLFKLQGIEIIEHLVSPKLDTQKIRDSVIELVKNHVEKVRIEVSSNWSQRMYQDLNHNISDLKLMEEKFKSYSYIFPSSWSTGIVESVQKEIDKLGNDASSLLQTRTAANESRDEFRRCFMRMGAVLVELPLFKDYTKNVMSDVLESCLNSDWGYGFVFELGLSLQKGEDTNNDDGMYLVFVVIQFVKCGMYSFSFCHTPELSNM
jgi:GTPase SAR1 family protein